MSTAEKFASSIGKGRVAGFAGTAAMTVSSTLEAKLRDAPRDAWSNLRRSAARTPAPERPRALPHGRAALHTRGRRRRGAGTSAPGATGPPARAARSFACLKFRKAK